MFTPENIANDWSLTACLHETHVLAISSLIIIRVWEYIDSVKCVHHETCLHGTTLFLMEGCSCLSFVFHLYFLKKLLFSGFVARDVSILHQVGHVLLEACISGSKRKRRFIIADDCFELSRVPKEKSVHVLKKAIEGLSGCKCH